MNNLTKGLSALAFVTLAYGHASAQSILINEFVADHTGTDTLEFVELFGAPNMSLSNYRILHIEGDSTGAGVIDTIFTPGTTDALGYWFTGFQSNSIENGSITLLLVSGFTGSISQDLDIDNDGVFDVTPWSAEIDSVGISDGGAGDRVYSSSSLTPNFDGNPNKPGGASRIPNGQDTNTVADWMRNDFDLAGIPGFPGTLGANEALNTPGAVNAVPEPASMAALGLGVAALIRRRRK